ncbi:LytR/AlgR family response regulator transcription factor [Neolewinella persica]|uniref:LytR/AlgR family response regulator transcription factor n=1 Tax=Neolewinella persica TaxID=70998 RepID=UPI0003A79A02|nr:LytTR family DNA-binding domain-containing protein [Neolewinella persica]
MITYLIIDDEHMAHNIIQGYCDLLPNLERSGNAYDAIEAMQHLQAHDVDLIFLDLNMPKLRGFDFLKTLTHPPKVIVTTAYREFALEGFELNVVDYLLKPFGFDRFLKAMNKVISPTKTERRTDLAATTRPASDRIFLRGDKKYVQVAVDDILLLEAAGNYTKVITTDATIVTRDKISNLLSFLPPDDFLQVHKSFAVAIPHIISIEGNRISISTHLVPIGKMYKAEVNQLLS